MRQLSEPQRKGIPMHSRFWYCVFLAGLFVLLPTIALIIGVISSTHALAAPLHPYPSRNAFTVSPTRGPVGAIVTVSGSGMFLTQGTQIHLGYTADGRTCTIVAGGQSGIVHRGSFSGWFRWPTSTGTGFFGVCVSTNDVSAQEIGSYQVLSASAPYIAVTPTAPKAGQQATVSGANFVPGGTSVRLVWSLANGEQSIMLGTASSDDTGAFSYTFTVPSHASTGSYSVIGMAGGGSPAALSATTTFHVDGITIVAVPTPTAKPGPTATPKPTPTTNTTIESHMITPAGQSANESGDLASKSSLFLPIALGGTLLIALALGAGLLVMRRQRNLNAAFVVPPKPSPWSATDMGHPGADASTMMFTPWPAAMYPDGNSLMGANPGIEYSPMPVPTIPRAVPDNSTSMIPFDPGLAEAMREAQVSLFATPRPPLDEEIVALQSHGGAGMEPGQLPFAFKKTSARN